MTRLAETVRSVLVWEETDENITLRAATGSRRGALGLLWTLWRTRWLPYRTCTWDPETDEFGPYKWNRPRWKR